MADSPLWSRIVDYLTHRDLANAPRDPQGRMPMSALRDTLTNEAIGMTQPGVVMGPGKELFMSKVHPKLGAAMERVPEKFNVEAPHVGGIPGAGPEVDAQYWPRSGGRELRQAGEPIGNIKVQTTLNSEGATHEGLHAMWHKKWLDAGYKEPPAANIGAVGYPRPNNDAVIGMMRDYAMRDPQWAKYAASASHMGLYPAQAMQEATIESMMRRSLGLSPPGYSGLRPEHIGDVESLGNLSSPFVDYLHKLWGGSMAP